MAQAYYVLCAVAIVMIFVALVLVLRLRRFAKGGYVGQAVNVLLVFILFFLVAYLVTPFLLSIPPEYGFILMGVVFLFGALFVVLVLRLIDSLVRKVFEELDL